MEEWRDISGYEGYYQVSNLGNVRSVDRIIKSDKLLGRKRVISGRAMTKMLTKEGYFRVRLSRDHKPETRFIHHLVALAFIGDRPLGYDLHHIDSNRLNNKPENLQYLSRAEHIGGELNPYTTLGKSDVVEIRRLYVESDLTYQQIADRYSMKRGAIQSILNGNSWKHVPVTSRDKRYLRGSNNNKTTLTEEQVRQIRTDFEAGNVTFSELGRRYGTTYQTIQNVVRRVTWKHVY